MNPDELKFYYGPYGKPGLEKKTNPEMIQFNISHSHGLALCAVAHKREVGVDLEYIHEDHSFGSIAEHFFSKQEAVALNSCPEHLRLKLFFKLWTRKEALMKADGMGLALDLNQYKVLMRQNEMRISRKPGNELQCIDIWSLRDLDAGPGYSAALAVEGQAGNSRCWQWKDSSPGFRAVERQSVKK
jgi:4'-phosphopantetheinyl transferase